MASYFEPSITAAQAANADAAATVELNGSSQAQIVRPNLALSMIVTGGGVAWTYGNWFQIAAANDLALHALVEIAFAPRSAPDEFQYQFGVGAAGFEVAIGEYAVGLQNLGGGNVVPPVVRLVPALLIPANARVAIRCAAFGGAISFYAHFGFLPRPF